MKNRLLDMGWAMEDQTAFMVDKDCGTRDRLGEGKQDRGCKFDKLEGYAGYWGQNDLT